jgi:CTP-dependent riboflavin kinase
MDGDHTLSTLLGVRLFPGSANIYVSGEHHLFEQDFRPESVRRVGHLRAVPCTVTHGTTNREGFIVRTELNCPFNPRTARPNTMFEVIAGSHLRTELGLEADESAVEIEFDPLGARCFQIQVEGAEPKTA